MRAVGFIGKGKHKGCLQCEMLCFYFTTKVSSFIEALTRLRVRYDYMMVVEVISRWKLSKLYIASPFI